MLLSDERISKGAGLGLGQPRRADERGQADSLFVYSCMLFYSRLHLYGAYWLASLPFLALLIYLLEEHRLESRRRGKWAKSTDG
jgi:hypothetical protein